MGACPAAVPASSTTPRVANANMFLLIEPLLLPRPANRSTSHPPARHGKRRKRASTWFGNRQPQRVSSARKVRLPFAKVHDVDKSIRIEIAQRAGRHIRPIVGLDDVVVVDRDAADAVDVARRQMIGNL